jgi:hypothetical protein
MNQPPEQTTRKIAPCSHSVGRLNELAAQQANMTPSLALEPLKTRLQSLADGSATVLPLPELNLLREAGLSSEEIAALVFANQNLIPDIDSKSSLSPEDTARLKLVAGMMAHCLRVYGSENALSWLRQSIRHFDRQSPLEFLIATRNFDEVDGYLIEASEGYFF